MSIPHWRVTGDPPPEGWPPTGSAGCPVETDQPLDSNVGKYTTLPIEDRVPDQNNGSETGHPT